MLIAGKCAAAMNIIMINMTSMAGALQLRKPEEKKIQMKQYNEKNTIRNWMNCPAAGRTIYS